VASPVAGEIPSALVVGPAQDLESLLPDGLLAEIDRAENAAQAIVRLIRKPYHLILVDHVADGEVTEEQIAYMRALQAIRPESKTIVLVSNTTTRKVIEGLRHGAFAYFGRPFEPSAVRETIAHALSTPNWSDGIELLSAEPDFISVRLRCRLQTADRLAHFMKEIPSALTEDDRAELSVAFHEMLLNAIEHGGKLDPDEWVRVSRVRTRRTIVYHILDPGEGFSRTDLPHAAISNAPNEPLAHFKVRVQQNMRSGGFGMLIASHSVDEVIYNQQGNEVILIKHLE
jgi:anti-sigma regulatory factor (Ser/Thr protein kinase)/CheY-like chemotaxis protein